MGLVPDTFAPKTGGPSPQRGPHAGKGYSRRNGALQSSWACRRTDTLLRDVCGLALSLSRRPSVSERRPWISFVRLVGAWVLRPAHPGRQSPSGGRISPLGRAPCVPVIAFETHKERPPGRGLIQLLALGVVHMLQQACRAGLLRTRSARHAISVTP